MSDTSWQFRTAKGVVTVENECIRIRRTLRQFLAGQRLHWRAGDRSERTKIAFRVVWLVAGLAVGLGYVVYHAHQLLDIGVAGAGIMTALSLVVGAYGLWSSHLRQTTIPLTSVERVSLDETNRKLTITHETSRFRKLLLDWTAGTQRFTFPTDDELREAREIFRLRGIHVDEVDEGRDTVYRFVTEDGVYFCASCERQVSPADSTCPSCGYALRVERERGSEAERASEVERSVEF